MRSCGNVHDCKFPVVEEVVMIILRWLLLAGVVFAGGVIGGS